MTTNPIDLTIELRSANGSSAEYYQANEEDVRETLRVLALPQLFAQRHLLLASQHCASMIPCKGIDMILVRTFARTPLKFPLNLPVGRFDLVEQPEAWPDHKSAAIEHQKNQQEHGSRLAQLAGGDTYPRRLDGHTESGGDDSRKCSGRASIVFAFA
jgi:hypothetical protein